MSLKLLLSDGHYADRMEPNGFCFAYQSQIYLAPAPFQIYKISWLNDVLEQESKLVPVESHIEIYLTA